MITTFFDEIRDMQSHKLEQATPTSMSAVKFERALPEVDFRDWADANPQACLRRFAIADLFEYDEVFAQNGDIEPVTMRAELVIAYPNDRRYGGEGRNDMFDLIRQDMLTVTKRCGFLASGTTWPRFAASEDSWSVESEASDVVTFLVVQYELRFWEDVSSTRRDFLFNGNDPVTIDGAQVYN